jgi:hypothetical protein
MTERSLHPLAEDYLERLQRAGRDLPPARRRELSADIEDYLSEAIAPGASDREARHALERLGSPSEIVEAEQPAADGPDDRRSWRVGWLVGLVLLWSSRLWTTRDKLVGTLIVPGGIATVVVVLLLTGTKRRCTDLLTHSSTGTLITKVNCAPSAGPSSATTVWQIALLAFVVLGPVITAIYLARRTRATPARAAAPSL